MCTQSCFIYIYIYIYILIIYFSVDGWLVAGVLFCRIRQNYIFRYWKKKIRNDILSLNWIGLWGGRDGCPWHWWNHHVYLSKFNYNFWLRFIELGVIIIIIIILPPFFFFHFASYGKWIFFVLYFGYIFIIIINNW